MNEHLAELARRLRESVLTRPGDAETTLRRAVEAQAAARNEQADEIPAELKAYVEKVARHAYKVTDSDVEALKQAGYSEDAIFEITISAAVGAATARLERGLAALKGAT